MIIPMARVRILGPREELDATLTAVQHEQVLHVSDVPSMPGIRPARLDARRERRRRQLQRVLDDSTVVLGSDDATAASTRAPPSVAQLAEWARLAHRTRRALQRVADRETALQEEQALVARYREFLAAVQPLLRRVASSSRLASRVVVVPAALRGAIDTLAGLLPRGSRR